MNLRSHALVTSLAAASAVLSLGGAAYVAGLPADSVGHRQLKDDAVTGANVRNGSLGGKDVRDGSLSGKDVREDSLGTVPSAQSAQSAQSARTALVAEQAKQATVAGTAYTTGHQAGETIQATGPATGTYARLTLPAGSYVLSAKAQIDMFGNQDIVGCDLVAGPRTDSSFVQGAADTHTSQVLSTSTVSTLAAGGVVELRCSKGFPSSSPAISQVRLTAVSVGTVVEQP